MRRVMSIWFPQLPLDRRARLGDGRIDGPFATISEIKNAWRLVNISDAARRAGLSPHMSVTDARAICPDLLTEPCNPSREERLLRAIWRWADKLSPSIALDLPDGLFLDIEGCAHLFGDESGMAEIARSDLVQMQMNPRIGICDTKRGAWALSHFGSSQTSISQSGATKDALAKLPIAALNVAPKIENDLRRAGLKTIGSLYGFKTSELARRFGLGLTDNLTFALGYAADPVSRQAVDPVFAARMTLPEPIGMIDDMLEVLRRLAASVCGRLEDSQNGARQFILTVRCVDTGDHPLSVGFARPCFLVDQLIQQLRPKLDALKIEFGADWFRLEAKVIEPLKPEQLSLETNGHSKDANAFAQILSTLGNRLGFDHVLKAEPCDSHSPECEYQWAQAVSTSQQDWPDEIRLRPERLFPQPEYMRVLQDGRPPKRFEWRRMAYEAVDTIGPERITPSWYAEGDKRLRDYWIVRTQSGLALWLVSFPASQPPEWYVAGRFA